MSVVIHLGKVSKVELFVSKGENPEFDKGKIGLLLYIHFSKMSA